MKKLLKNTGNILSVLSVAMILNINTTVAATRLTPYHLYLWAKNANVTRLDEFRHYINIKDYNTSNTALCIAQQQKDYSAYKLLLQFGATPHVPCHDNSNLQTRKIIRETGGFNSGLVLLGTAALGAGAVALALKGGGSSSGSSCDLNNYPLESCPEHGICSACSGKYKLDSCEQFWQESDNACIPAGCPSGTALKGECKEKDGTFLEESPSSSYSGTMQCYTCRYTCDETGGFHQNKQICLSTYPGYDCKQHANGCYIMDIALQCPTGEATSCAERDNFTLTQTKTGNLSGANPCYKCTYAPKPCPDGQHTSGNCPAKTGKTPVQTPSGSYSGNDACYTCAYSCDTANNYYETSGDCETANPEKICTLDTTSGDCYKPTACNTDKGYYGTESEFKNIYSGYNYIMKNGCFAKGTAKACTDYAPNLVTDGNCPEITGKTPSYTAETGKFSGESQCYSCSYSCDTANQWYNSQSECTTANTGKSCAVQSNGCYRVSGCDTSKGYYDNTTACQKANSNKVCGSDETSGCIKAGDCDNSRGYYSLTEFNKKYPGYNAVLDNGCYIKGEAKTCPEGESVSSCTFRPGNTTYQNFNGNYAGDKECYICEYACNNDLKYYQTNSECINDNIGASCTKDNTSECYSPTSCDENLSYYKKVKDCEAKFQKGKQNYACVLYEVTATLPCYTKGDPLDCTAGSTTCEQPANSVFTVNGELNGYYSGSNACYTCNYDCNGGYYDNKTECTHSGGYSCSAAGTMENVTCWERGTANECSSGDTKYQSAADCGDNGEKGWNYTVAGYAGDLNCGICAELTCNSGYSEAYQSAADCGDKSQGANGWEYENDETRFYGELKCGKCTPKSCLDNSTIKHCSDRTGNYTIASAENEYGANGDNICYLCTFNCNETTAYALEEDCETGGYKCQEITENGKNCYIHAGSQSCPTDYPQQNTACTPEATGYKTYEDSQKVGDNTCYRCDYQCDTTTGWIAGTCPDGKECDDSITSPVSCYLNPRCPSDYPFTDKETCEADGYSCVESAEGSDCWKYSTATDCPDTTYTAGLTDCSGLDTPASSWNYLSSGKSGGKVCGKCEAVKCENGDTAYQSASDCGIGGEQGWQYSFSSYSGNLKCGVCTALTTCDDGSTDITDETSCGVGGTSGWTAKIVDYVGNTPCRECVPSGCPENTAKECPAGTYITPSEKDSGNYSGNDVCYSCNYTCNETSAYADINDCTAGGWECEAKTETAADTGESLTCHIHKKESGCPTGFDAGRNNCDDKTRPKGWSVTYDGESGGKVCGKCVQTPCPSDTTANIVCNAGTYTNYVIKNTDPASYYGDEICQTCSYACNEETGFQKPEDCETDGYTCDTKEENGKTCYYHAGSETCPDDYPDDSACSAGTGYTTGDKTQSVGFNTCHKCTYACDTENNWNTTCPDGKACNEIILPDNSDTCYKVTGCPTGYPFDDEDECTSGGWVCEESAKGSECWQRTTSPSGCPQDYDTTVQDVKDCGNGSTGALGWELVDSDTDSGGLNCTKCEKLNCNSNFSTAYQSIENCGNGTIGERGWDFTTDTTRYNGDTSCGQCSEKNCPAGYTGNAQCEQGTYTSVATITLNNTYSGDSRCSKCDDTYYCNGVNSFEEEESCEQAGYVCETTEENGTTCYIRQQTASCEDGYTRGLTDCSGLTTPESSWEYSSSGYSAGEICGKCEAANCPENEYTTGDCPTQAGKVTVESIGSGFSGKNQCYTCSYICDTANGYFDDGDACNEKYPEFSCVPDETSSCYTTNGCNTDAGWYESKELCKAGNLGYECASSQGCWQTTSEESECPENEYTTCPSLTGKTSTAAPTGNKSGEDYCNTCTYTCDTNRRYYEDETACTEAQPEYLCVEDDESGCFVPTDCNNETAFTYEDDCLEKYDGYTCKTSNGCYVKGSEKQCPADKYTTCPAKEGNNVEATPTENKSGDNYCNTCTYTCDTEQNYYTEQEDCLQLYPSHTCAKNENANCYMPTLCDNSRGYYGGLPACQENFPGYECVQTSDLCYTKGDIKDCPDGEKTEGNCPTRVGNTLKEEESGNYTGDNKCYTCVYTCLSDNGYYDDAESCEADENNYGRTCAKNDESQCYMVTGCRSDVGWYADKDACENKFVGYECVSNGVCYVKSDIAKDCPTGQFTAGLCPAKTGNTLTEEESGSMSGDNKCYNCVYTCTGDRYYTNEELCAAANIGKSCYTDTESSCFVAGTCDELKNFYNTPEACESANAGYYCTQAESSSCYIKDANNPKICPGNEVLAGNCEEKPYTDLEEIASGSYAGDDACYTCNYTCDTDNGRYDTSDGCKEANANFSCELETESGCYIKGDASDCPDEQYTSGNCPAKTGKKVSYEESGSYSGTDACYTCNYTCDTDNGYYDDDTTCTGSNTGRTCSVDNESECYRPTGCDEEQGYYEDEKKCLTEYNGYACKSKNGCYVKDENQIAECPDDEQLTCPDRTGLIANPKQTDHKSGEAYCNICTYTCDTANGYYDADTACATANTGWICEQDTTSSCYTKSACDENNGYYTEQSACEDAYGGGYNCTLFNGCYIEGEAKSCPAGEEKTTCTPPTGKILTSQTGTEDKSGEEQCVKCEYTCDTANNYYEESSACQTAHPQKICSLVAADDTSGCWYPKTCDTGKNYYDSSDECRTAYQNGYTCTLDNECYVKGDIADCPDGEYTSCDDIEGMSLKEEETGNMKGTEQCYRCIYSCDSSQGRYADDASCTEANPEYACTEETSTKCFIKSQCNTSAGWYSSTTVCKGANSGWRCDLEQNGCVGKGTAKECGEDSTGDDVYATAGNCPAKTGNTTTERTISNLLSGDEQCYRCSYTCNEDLGYYSTSNTVSCKADNGGTACTLDSDSGCYIRNICTEEGTYNTKTLCENANTGWECALSGNCYVTNTASACPDGEYTACEDKTGIGLAVNKQETTDKSGDDPCYICEYSCDESNGYYEECPEGNTCTQDETSGCYKASGTEITASVSDLVNQTKISVTSEAGSEEDVYGLKSSGDITNTSLTKNKLVNGTMVSETTYGEVNIEHYGDGTAYGMYGSGSGTILNDTGASVNIKSYNGGDAVGIYSGQGGTVTNKGDITVSGNAQTAVGILGEGGNTISNAGNITVTSEGEGEAYGIRVLDGTNTTITNEKTGVISVTAGSESNAHGIYIDQNGTSATVTNNGTIKINGTVKEGSTGITLNGASLRNASQVTFTNSVNLNDFDGKFYLEDGGVYEAESLSGDLNVGTSVVMDDNLDTYIVEDSLVADNTENLNLISESALFNASAQQSSNGGTDTVLERRDFHELALNSSIGDYLEQNYTAGNLENMFNDIKSETTDFAAGKKIADKTGANILPSFADENFQTLKSLNRNVADTILKPTDEQYRVLAGYDNHSLEADAESYLSEYDLSANSVYTFGDKRLDNKNRLGLGLGYTKISTSYDDGGDRDLEIFSLFMPYMHKFTDNLRLASILSVGYGTGEYDRGSNRESDITDYFYGLTNELRYTMDLNGFAELEPALMLNALGYTEDGFDEGSGDEALVTRKTQNLSVEGGIGLFLKKSVAMEKYGKLGFKVGGVYYHEFAEPYDDIRGSLRAGSGWYSINDYAGIYKRDRAVLEAAAEYEYKAISVLFKYNRLIQKNNPQLFDLGIKYKF